ncbi:SusD/RagB family nutrient-binding outer membrane lipoprotein [Rhizosphaericola mali]|uniref:SusD/RagB family nutrient-binding outer membrane lipoprotein n=2 Tax=Rhizosphaericola mali TaxID=2545455 RepID=A0A5P2GBG0_9BACT|nr:SusD/RagB family nutrient-binding outer membrane lipoprotein [Rhizosphaericola mali]
MILSLLGLCIILSISCTKKYNDINTNPNALTSVSSADLPYIFTKAEDASMWSTSYQVAQNLNADQYAQYFACVATYFPSDRYVMRDDWFNSAWTSIYSDMLPQLQTIFQNTDPTSAEYSLANIIWVLGFDRITDYWGPIPYFKAGQIADYVAYDSQDSVYYDFFKRLDSSITNLKSHTSETPFGTSDIIYSGNVTSWLKFANTLKLRLAMRISGVAPTLAQKYAEEAVADGVMTTSTADDALMLKSVNTVNGLSMMSDWNEFRMSAAMGSILNGYNDPRIGVYFLPAVNSSKYRGLRNGLSTTQLGQSGNMAGDNSHVGPRWASTSFAGGTATYLSTSQNVMCTAEAYFLRAEAKLLGWNMGSETVQELYEDGIKASMTQWGITDATTIANYINGTTLPAAPGDNLSSAAVSDVPVKFGATAAIQKRQIAIQKWLAIFPDGTEAWADYRRSHAFSLYPVVNSDNTDIPDPTKQYIRRLTFLIQEKQSNAKGLASGYTELGGDDKITTPLWWDLN